MQSNRLSDDKTAANPSNLWESGSGAAQRCVRLRLAVTNCTTSLRFGASLLALSLAAAGALLGGCAVVTPSEGGEHITADDTATAVGSLSTHNRLALNRLALNRLALNQISATQFAFDPGHEMLDTQEEREVLAYVVECALAEGVVVVAETEHGSYQFPGLLGLAPGWAEQMPSPGDLERVSACLLARVNAFGESVMLSLRTPGLLDAAASERASYPVYEGAFFGQVFAEDEADQHFYACQGSPADTAVLHAASRALRVCTDADSECGITALGRCRDLCDSYTDEGGWSGCWAEGARHDQTINVYLAASDIDGANQRCDGGPCQMRARDGDTAILDCEGQDCLTTCEEGATCAIAAANVDELDASVRSTALAEIDCYGANTCQLSCDQGAYCATECAGTNNCDVTCRGGAECEVFCGSEANNCDQLVCKTDARCLLTCSSANNCSFAVCEGGETQCGGGVVVCNRPCP